MYYVLCACVLDKSSSRTREKEIGEFFIRQCTQDNGQGPGPCVIISESKRFRASNRTRDDEKEIKIKTQEINEKDRAT